MTDPAKEPETTPARARWSTPRVLLILVPLFLYYAMPIGFWPWQMGANQTAHAYLALALAQRGETCVDQEVRDYIYNHDLVFRGGHFFSNKPPGAAIWLAAAAYGLDLLTPGSLELPTLLYFGRLLMLTLPFVIFLYVLGRALERLAPPVVAWGLIVLYALATNAGAYVTVYFAHNLAAMGLTTAFLVLLFTRPRWHWLGGLAAGFGVLAEYQAAGVAVWLALFAFVRSVPRLHWRSGLLFGLGALPMAGVLLLFNYLSSGSSVELGYQTEFQSFGVASSESLGFRYPDPVKILLMLFSPSLGLLFFSPWLALVAPAAVSSFRTRSPWRWPVIAALLAFVTLLLTIASHLYWVGGAITGPRYLTAGLPFLLFPLAAWLGRLTERRSLWIMAGLIATGVLSLLFFALIQAVSPFIDTHPDHLDLNPLTSYIFPLMARGVATLTVVGVLGPYPTLSVVLYAALLFAAVAGFAIPAWFQAGPRMRRVALVSVAAGGVLFGLWTQLGTPEHAQRTRYLEQLPVRTTLKNQPQENGRIRFMRRLSAGTPVPVPERHVTVRRLHQGADRVLPESIEAEVLARDFKFILGAVECPDRSLVIADVENNTLHRYWPDGRMELIQDMVGSWGGWVVYLRRPGVNGVALDRKGGLILASAGNRNLSYLDRDRKLSVLVDKFEGKRLNGPRCPVIRSDGSVFFVDPALDFNEGPDDPHRELSFCGLYRWDGHELIALQRDLIAPTGLAFSPDETMLYVADWCQQVKNIYRFHVDEKGNLSGGRLFARILGAGLGIVTTGMLTDQAGHLYVTDDRSLWILAPYGTPLAQVILPEPSTALAWGGEDGRTLYVCGYSALYRIKVKIPGFRPTFGDRN